MQMKIKQKNGKLKPDRETTYLEENVLPILRDKCILMNIDITELDIYIQYTDMNFEGVETTVVGEANDIDKRIMIEPNPNGFTNEDLEKLIIHELVHIIQPCLTHESDAFKELVKFYMGKTPAKQFVKDKRFDFETE